MIEGQTVLALITARGGSKALKDKNLRKVGGKTLIARAVEAARQAQTVDRVVLSSDDPRLIADAERAGCDVPFVRPPELATDDARSVDVVRHAIETLPERYDFIVLLQPTSPLRTGADIDAAVRLCVERGAPSCVSVAEASKSPFWMFALDVFGHMQPVADQTQYSSRRQEVPPAYVANGAVYVARRETWLEAGENLVEPETVAYVMPKEHSVDIDDELDLAIAEAVLAWTGRTAES